MTILHTMHTCISGGLHPARKRPQKSGAGRWERLRNSTKGVSGRQQVVGNPRLAGMLQVRLPYCSDHQLEAIWTTSTPYTSKLISQFGLTVYHNNLYNLSPASWPLHTKMCCLHGKLPQVRCMILRNIFSSLFLFLTSVLLTHLTNHRTA